MKILALDLGKSKSVASIYESEEASNLYRTGRTSPRRCKNLIVEIGPAWVVFENGPAGWLQELEQENTRLGSCSLSMIWMCCAT